MVRTGENAYHYGLNTAAQIAALLGAEKVGAVNSNEFLYQAQRVVIKCAAQKTLSVGVTHTMLDRIDAVIGAFEITPGLYHLYRLTPEQYKQWMTPTRSKNNIGKVSEVRRSHFEQHGQFLQKVLLKPDFQDIQIPEEEGTETTGIPLLLRTISHPCDLDNLTQWYREECLAILEAGIRQVVQQVGENLSHYVCWPQKAQLLWEGCDRVREEKGKQRYHSFTDTIKQLAKENGVSLDSRSNGPAIGAYLLAGGERPGRFASNNCWSIHHIYNNKFPYIGKQRTLHAVKEGKHFTQSAGLVAIHPVADQMADEYPFFAWLLRAEAYKRFGYDPDGAFSALPSDDYGFCPPNACHIMHGQ